MSVVRYCVPLLLAGIVARGEEKKGVPPQKGKAEDSAAPAGPAKTGGSNQDSAPSKKSSNLQIPAALPEEARKALETAVKAYLVAEKAEKNRDKAAASARSS